MGIGKSFFESLKVKWAILSHLEMTIILIYLKSEDYGAHISFRS